jgi:hypothetical protein
MGRLAFKSVLVEVRKMKVYERRKMWIYGTMGYGKSHILAALVCYLLAKDQHVVYLADCNNVAYSPVESVRNALLLSFANDEERRSMIERCDDEKDLKTLVQELDLDLYFAIDQINALEESEGDSNVKKKAKASTWKLIEELAFNHLLIMSASANNMSFRKFSQAAQRNELSVILYGGLDEEVQFL